MQKDLSSPPFPFSFSFFFVLADDGCVATFYLLCVGPVSAKLLAAAEANPHRETGKTEGRERRSLRRLRGGAEEER